MAQITDVRMIVLDNNDWPVYADTRIALSNDNADDVAALDRFVAAFGQVHYPCDDCGRTTYWDEARGWYRHAERPAEGCFLVPPEPVAMPICSCTNEDLERNQRCTCAANAWEATT